MNGIKVFQNQQFGKVRTLEEDGKVLFCGFDVARALGYEKPRNAIAAHCKGALKRGILTSGGNQTLSFIPEGDVYRLITHSRLPAAEKFERWVFDEVLPTIRQYGAYLPDMTAVITQAVQAAVSQTIQAMMPFILADRNTTDTPKAKIHRRITSLIDQLETPLRMEMEELIMDSSYGYIAISDYFREQYGILISKSSIGRYAQRLYDTIEAQESAQKQ